MIRNVAYAPNVITDKNAVTIGMGELFFDTDFLLLLRIIILTYYIRFHDFPHFFHNLTRYSGLLFYDVVTVYYGFISVRASCRIFYIDNYPVLHPKKRMSFGTNNRSENHCIPY